MIKISLVNALSPSPDLIRRIRGAGKLKHVRNAFLISLLASMATFCFAVLGGASPYSALFQALVVASALTAASAPGLAQAYVAHALRRLIAKAPDCNELEFECQKLKRWTIAIAVSLAMIVAALNLTVIWVYGSAAMQDEIWPSAVTSWLRSAFLAGLIVLFIGDRVISAT